jgi:hypothetical protein
VEAVRTSMQDMVAGKACGKTLKLEFATSDVGIIMDDRRSG